MGMKKRILIAEDDRITQKVVRKVVEGMGCIAFVSPHGRHAYESLKAENRFDLLITDMMMPEMDGGHLVRTLRGDSQFLHLPILIMSAVVGAQEIEDVLRLGANRFLAKPLDMDALEAAIRASLAQG